MEPKLMASLARFPQLNMFLMAHLTLLLIVTLPALQAAPSKQSNDGESCIRSIKPLLPTECGKEAHDCPTFTKRMKCANRLICKKCSGPGRDAAIRAYPGKMQAEAEKHDCSSGNTMQECSKVDGGNDGGSGGGSSGTGPDGGTSSSDLKWVLWLVVGMLSFIALLLAICVVTWFMRKPNDDGRNDDYGRRRKFAPRRRDNLSNAYTTRSRLSRS